MHYQRALPLLAVSALLAVGCDRSQLPGSARNDGTEVSGLQAAEAPKPASDTSQVLVTVNGEPVTTNMFGVYLTERLQSLPGAKNTPQIQSQAANELINIMLVAEDARKQELDQRQGIQAALKLQQEQLLSRLALQNYWKEHQPTEKDLKKAYDKRYGEASDVEFKARHILVKEEDTAKDLIGQLDQGGDFAALAKEHSTGPTGKSGGDLGWFDPAQMVKPFSDKVKGMKPGEYTKEPVKTRFGWHVILLEETRAAQPPKFEEVRDQLSQALQKQTLAQYINGLRQKADVEFNQDVVGKKPAAEGTANPSEATTSEATAK